MDQIRLCNGGSTGVRLSRGFRALRPCPSHRAGVLTGVLVAMAWGSISQAHLEAVRVEAIFPTAGRSGIQLQIFGADSGL